VFGLALLEQLMAVVPVVKSNLENRIGDLITKVAAHESAGAADSKGVLLSDERRLSLLTRFKEKEGGAREHLASLDAFIADPVAQIKFISEAETPPSTGEILQTSIPAVFSVCFERKVSGAVHGKTPFVFLISLRKVTPLTPANIHIAAVADEAVIVAPVKDPNKGD